MLKTYCKIAFRVLFRNKTYSTLNILGLALSMSCGILIFTLVKYHLSFDNFHKDSSRIYRFVTEQHRDIVSYTGSVPPPFGKAFRDDYSFSEQTARIASWESTQVSFHVGADLKKFKEKDGMAFTEAGYFDIFNFPLLKGDKTTALTEPNTAIITESTAHKYFGREDPMGKTIRLDDKIDCRITGILKDLPVNSDRQTTIFVSWPTLRSYNEWMTQDDSWGGISSELQCFTRLRPGVDPRQVEQLLPAYVKKYRPKSKNVHIYKLQPLAEIHFDARYGGPMAMRNLWILGIIGLFLLITACVNFVNLATAQALRRSKEVGIRRVLGSLRGQLFWQFIAETGLITLVAAGLAICLSLVALPTVNEWFESRMSIDFADLQLLLFIPLLILVVTFLAGAYPGLILSGFRPVVALKGRLSQQHIGGFNMRRALIVTQFTISLILIMAMLVITRQMEYTKDTDLGFNKDAIVMLPMGGPAGLQANTLQQRLAAIPGVEKVSLCYAAPAWEDSWTTTVRFDTRSEAEIFRVNVKSADDQYLQTFGLHLVAGRNIFPSDSARECVLNETMINKLQLATPGEALGKNIRMNGKDLTVTGVVKDFHDRSLHEDIDALCITSYAENYQAYAVRLNMKNITAVMPALEKTWSSSFPGKIYEYQFLDESIASFYRTESIILKFVSIFSFIAIFIGCLGLYGLVAFMVTQKTKEIGIRKILGSTVTGILWIFGKEFGRLIVIAFLVAAPAAWWFMSMWLRNFKYHIVLGPWLFIAGLLIIAGIAAFTIGYQSIRAALANPVKSIRTE
ncbi:ABC transporter permease [Flavitalea sp. BT771]|uniref:ABC transporter permease n=1 Tax=Flavitalea sp. BT771 TaxID=3063329 RepID=UPI0026E229C6|nr:ABC transporter permease [Flavitalea sp. BT771]MDO6434832.1 ABC transporter permease [Flavitalea sp. BT771]MDV6223732.1 ABC transporter permease [Flavitalea sp. BT771]